MNDDTTKNILQRMKETVEQENQHRRNVVRWKLSRTAYNDYTRALSQPPEPPTYKDASGIVYTSPEPPVPPIPAPPSMRTKFANAEIVVSDDSNAPYFAYDTQDWRRWNVR